MRRGWGFLGVLLLGWALGQGLNLGFRDTPLAEALRLAFAASGENVLLVDLPGVKVTLEAQGVPRDELVRTLLASYAPGHTLVRLPGGLWVVAPKERAKELVQKEMRVYENLPPGLKEAFPGVSFMDLGKGRTAVLASPEEHQEIGRLVAQALPLVAVRTFPVVAEEAANLVKEAFPEVSAQYVRASRQLVVKGDPRTLVEVRALLAQSNLLGNPPEERLEIFSLRYLEPGKALEALKGLVDGETLSALKGDENLRILYGRVGPEEAERVRKALALLDQPKPQVELLVRIEQVDENLARSLGIDWQALSGGLTASILGGQLTLGLDTQANAALRVLAGLKAAEAKGASRTLVNTRLVTLDREAVRLVSGGKLLLPQQGPTPPGGGPGGQPAGYFAVEFGLTLDLTPQVVGEEILLKANVVLGSPPTSGPGGGVSIPAQSLGTTLRLKPGTTAVMGGVVTTLNSESTQGVPILSWIPLVGELFKVRQDSTSRSVVLVFVSAQPVTP